MNNTEFLTFLVKARASVSGVTELLAKLAEIDIFNKMVDIVQSRSQSYCDKVKSATKKEVPDGLSPLEAKWKKYFSDHSFSSVDEQRNMVDAIALVTGINVAKFVKIAKQTRGRFPCYVCIVPIGNTNSHDYKLGSPIITLSTGTTFFRANASTGNNMSLNPDDFRMPTRDEIAALIASIAYKSMSAAESMFYGLIVDSTLGEDE